MKVQVVMASVLVLSTVILLPMVQSDPMTAPVSTTCVAPSIHQSPPQLHHDEMEQLYDSIIEKINKGDDPTNETRELLQYQEIQEMLALIADNESRATIDILFSNKPSFVKRMYLLQQVTTANERQQTALQQHICWLCEVTLSHTLTSIDEIGALEIVQSVNISKQQLVDSETHWSTFLRGNPSVAALFDPEEFDLVVYALILFSCLLVYVLVSSGILTALATSDSVLIWQMGVGVIESLLFGIAMSGVIDELRFNVLGNRSIITWIAEEVIFRLVPFLSAYEDGITTMISSTLALVLIAGYFVVYMIPLFTFVAGGLFSLAIPLVASLIIYYLYDRWILGASPSI